MRAAVVVVVMLLTPWAARAQTPQWVRYQPKNGGFSVAFPRTPIEQHQPAARDGSPPLHVMAVMSPKRDKSEPAYVVMYRDLPPADAKRTDTADLLRERQQGIVNGAKGIALAEHELKLDGHPGREFVFESANVGYVRCRLYLVNGTLYHLSYFSMSQEASSVRSAEPFFDSFALSK